MSKEITKLEAWTYERAVEVVKPMVSAHKKLTLDLVKELDSARIALSNTGYRSDLTSGQMSRGSEGFSYNTWEGFCEDIGIEKRTANRWLLLFDPKEDRLLTQDEFKARKQAEFEDLIKKLEASVGKDIDWRPEGWSTACENYYQTKIRERKYFEIARRDHFEAAELFNREYLASLSAQLDYGTPEDILAFGELCEDIKPYAVKAVPVNKQARVLKLVETALNEFQPTVRRDVARFVAEMIIRRGDEQ